MVFDATANRVEYRERARREIARYLEVYVSTPLSVCIDRDPKAIYRNASQGETDDVPGLGAVQEPLEDADLTVAGDTETAEVSAGRILEALLKQGYVARGRES